MSIGNIGGVAADIGRFNINFPQRCGGQETATKSGEGRMDLKGGMAAGGSKSSTIEVR